MTFTSCRVSFFTAKRSAAIWCMHSRSHTHRHLKLKHNPAIERSNTRLQGCAIRPLSSFSLLASVSAFLVTALPLLFTYDLYIWCFKPPGADGAGYEVAIVRGASCCRETFFDF